MARRPALRPGAAGALRPPLDVLAVLLLALALRTVWLASVPPGILPDELTIGYDAWSLLLTGRDMHGAPWPLLFRSMGEYKNPLYIYATVPSVMLLGLNAHGARAPAVAFGTLTVGAAFLLGRALAGRRAGLAAALLLAVSPWHRHLSRVALDPIPVPFFVAAGWWLLEVGLRGGRWALPLAALSLSLACYSYAVPRLFAPLLVAGVLLARRRLAAARWRPLACSAALGALLLLPLARAYVADPQAAEARFNAVSIFNRDTLMWQAHRWGSWPPAALYALQFAENYISHLSPDYLFLRGNPSIRFSSRDTGIMYLFEAALLPVGLLALARRRRGADLVILWALALSPVAASLTGDNLPHPLRTIVAIPFLQLAGAVGWVRLRPRLGPLGRPLALALAAALVLLHLSHYFVSYPSDPGADYYWYHGWEEAGAYLRAHAGEHSEVRVPTKPTNYVDKFLLYHTARDPALYQAQGWAGTPYTFAPTCSYRAEGARPGVLYLVILEGWPLPEECRYDDLGLEAVHEVRFPDGKLAFLFLARPA